MALFKKPMHDDSIDSTKKVEKNMTIAGNSQDIIIFHEDGTPIASKSKFSDESDLFAGFLSVISTFISMITADRLTSISIGKNKILFKHVNDIIGALILGQNENENLASEALGRLMGEILESGVQDAQDVLSNFLINNNF
jgi:predicted regulator of Ras-like GTPase activity (Roadblock/LC7/MglB family)